MHLSDPADAIRYAYSGDYAAAGTMALVGRAGIINRDNSGDCWRHNVQGRIRAIVDGYLPEHPARHAWALLLCADVSKSPGALEYESVVLDWLFERVYRRRQYWGSNPMQVKRGNTVLCAIMRGTWQGKLYHSDGSLYISWLAEAVGLNRSQFVKSRYWGAFALVAIGELNQLTTAAMAPVEEYLQTLPRYGVAV